MSKQQDRNALGPAREVGPSPRTRHGPMPVRVSSRYPYNGTDADRRTPDSSLIIARYRMEQEALGRQAVMTIRDMWDRNINPEPFAASWPQFYPLLKQVVLMHYRASAASASKFYQALSYADGQRVTRVQAALPNTDKLDRVSDSVANGAFYHQLNKMKREPGDASLIARNSVSGAGARFALMGGRDTVIAMALNDPKSAGWERLTEQNACSFCVMHAARGPFSGGMSDFHPHDYCNCVACPMFRGQQPANEALTSEWRQVTQGKTGPEARAAWEEYHGQNATS